MANDGKSGQIPITSLVHGSQAPVSIFNQQQSGKSLPPGGRGAANSAAPTAPASPAAAPARISDPSALVALINRQLNDSGRPDQFQLDPSSGGKVIQQINPATGAIIGEFAVSEFPALARSIGALGLVIDRRA